MSTYIRKGLSVALPLIIGFSVSFSSCSKMLETDSELVEFEKDNQLNHATDSVYSTLGIINKIQAIADRVVLLGEARADLVQTTEQASADLKRLASFDLKSANKYNCVSDYYAVINNCNYFLAHADTTLQRRGHSVLLSEYAAVKSFRAWTYLQLVQAYGRVPLVLKPVMTEQEARDAMNQPYADIKTICQYFIDDLTPYVGVELPRFGVIDGWDSQQFFIPMRVLLGDLCLWAGRYQESAKWYHDFITDVRKPVMLSISRSYWPDPTQYVRPVEGYYVTSTAELLSFVPMESRIFDGYVSDLPNIFESTNQNYFYYQLTPSEGMRELSRAQIYATEYKTSTQTDTIYAPRTGLISNIYVGDLRLTSNYNLSAWGGQGDYSEYNTVYQSMSKIWHAGLVPTYRRSMVYLRYAEALNRAGLPQSALVVLKYGMCEDNVNLYVDEDERAKAGNLISFDPNVFKKLDSDGNLAIYGIHSFGSGDSHANKQYVLPQPTTALASKQDTVDYQIPLVENMIIDEMALEGSFEGNRFYDLMRVALRRSDPAYLADPIARRSGSIDNTLRTLLMDANNWYLPLNTENGSVFKQ